MRRHHLGHWRGTGRSRAARRGTTSTVRSDFFLPTQFDLSTLGTVSLARLLVDLHVVSCPTLNGFILAGLPLKNYWHSSFGLASSWRWGKGGIAPTLHFRNRWKTISPFVLLCRKTSMRRSWPQTQIAGFKKIHVLSFDFIIMTICFFSTLKSCRSQKLRSRSNSLTKSQWDWWYSQPFCSLSIKFDWIKEKLLHEWWYVSTHLPIYIVLLKSTSYLLLRVNTW